MVPGKLVDITLGHLDLGKLATDAGPVVANGQFFAPYAGARGKLKASEFAVGLRC